MQTTEKTFGTLAKPRGPIPPFVADLAEMLTNRGYVPSPGSWWDDDQAYVFSSETYGPATYGHPRCELHWRAADPGRVRVVDGSGSLVVNLPL